MNKKDKQTFKALITAFECTKEKGEISIIDNEKMKDNYIKSGNIGLAGFHSGFACCEKAYVEWVEKVINGLQEVIEDDKK